MSTVVATKVANCATVSSGSMINFPVVFSPLSLSFLNRFLGPFVSTLFLQCSFLMGWVDGLWYEPLESEKKKKLIINLAHRETTTAANWGYSRISTPVVQTSYCKSLRRFFFCCSRIFIPSNHIWSVQSEEDNRRSLPGSRSCVKVFILSFGSLLSLYLLFSCQSFCLLVTCFAFALIQKVYSYVTVYVIIALHSLFCAFPHFVASYNSGALIFWLLVI